MKDYMYALMACYCIECEVKDGTMEAHIATLIGFRDGYLILRSDKGEELAKEGVTPILRESMTEEEKKEFADDNGFKSKVMCDIVLRTIFKEGAYDIDYIIWLLERKINPFGKELFESGELIKKESL